MLVALVLALVAGRGAALPLSRAAAACWEALPSTEPSHAALNQAELSHAASTRG